MRTLSATLTTTQQGASGTPYIEIVLTSPDLLTTYTFKTTDATPRIFSGKISEGVWGTTTRPILRLKNQDQYFSAKDLRGYKADIKWGYNTPSGNESSTMQPLWVYDQREVSAEGELLTELELVDVWWKLGKLRVVGGGTKLEGTIVGTFQYGEAVSGATGSAERVLSIGTDHIIVTGVTGTFTIGQVITGGTSGATITLTATASAGGGVGAAPAWTTTTIFNIIASMMADTATLIDDTAAADPRINDTPEYTANEFEGIARIIRVMIQLTNSMFRVQNDGDAHLRFMTIPGSPDYSYDGSHIFFEEFRDQKLVIPNKIFAVDELPPDGQFSFWGVASDATSVAAIGQILKIVQDPSIISNAEAALVAATTLKRIQEETVSGVFEASMNCGQELLDWVSIVDSRAGITVTGRVGLITRNFESGKYSIRIQLGGLLDELDLSSPEALMSSILNMGYGRASIPGGALTDPIINPSVTIDAGAITYTPAVAGDWSPTVSTGKAGLDQLASRVKTLETTPVAHNILSVTHSDTLAGAVVIGDIMVANGTPKWGRLAIQVPAANVRNVVGVDNGEIVPTWKTALDATNPAAIAVTASPGTSLVFSHRDHIHAHGSLAAIANAHAWADIDKTTSSLNDITTRVIGAGEANPLLTVGTITSTGTPAFVLNVKDADLVNRSVSINFQTGDTERWRIRVGNTNLDSTFKLRFMSNVTADVVRFGQGGDIFCNDAIYPSNQITYYLAANANGLHTLGKFGIGQILPAWALNIKGSGVGAGIHIENTASAQNGSIYMSDAGGLKFRTAGSDRLAIADGGGVTVVSLAGTGTRTVVADANGVLSAP